MGQVMALSVQVRYRQAPQAAWVRLLDQGAVMVQFEQPQRAVTPGQSLVLYQGDCCLGGAPILATDALFDPQRDQHHWRIMADS